VRLRQAGVEWATDGVEVAVRVDDLARLWAALKETGSARPDMMAYLHKGDGKQGPLELQSLGLTDLQSCDYISVGSLAEPGNYRIGIDGYLKLLLVEFDAKRRRHLTRTWQADRFDWTEFFAPPDTGDAREVGLTGSAPSATIGPVDVVYTWVDASDDEWLRAHSRYSPETTFDESANNVERYIDRAELRYSMRSIWMFAPFVRHIYIVTAGQRPAWLKHHPQVTIIHHDEIFPDRSALPTFNSHAIESCLHRIAGLSENFVYFNDDVFLGRETSAGDFFSMGRLAKVRLSPRAFIYSGRPVESAIPTDWAAYNSTRLIERDFGLSFNRRLLHVPFPLKRGVIRQIEERYADEMEATRRSRFRATTDVALASMLAHYYGIATRHAVEWESSSCDYVYVNTGRADAERRYATVLDRRPRFFCLNVTRDRDFPLREQQDMLARFMEEVFPVRAPWERE
jgi:hypothetical protein